MGVKKKKIYIPWIPYARVQGIYFACVCVCLCVYTFGARQS